MTRAPNAGRLAGFTYLILIVFSATGYATMTSLLSGDPGTLPPRLAASHTLFVVALAAMAIGFVAAWAALGVLLYRLMSAAGRLAGRLMLIGMCVWLLVKGAAPRSAPKRDYPDPVRQPL